MVSDFMTNLTPVRYDVFYRFKESDAHFWDFETEAFYAQDRYRHNSVNNFASKKFTDKYGFSKFEILRVSLKKDEN